MLLSCLEKVKFETYIDFTVLCLNLKKKKTDGNVYLAAHYANAQSQTIHIYKITIRFTHGSREGGGK